MKNQKKKILKWSKNRILRKRANPKTINLPNSRSFVSKWERISRKQLPINIKVTRNRTIGPRRNNQQIYFNLAREGFKNIKRKRRKDVMKRLAPVYDKVNQTGSGLVSSLVKAGFDLGAKALGSEFGKKTNKQRHW